MSAESAVAKTVAIPRSIPPHLLMTSILEQICHSYVKDPVKAQQLFKGSYKKCLQFGQIFLCIFI